MKKNYFKRALLVGAGLVFLSITVFTAFAETAVSSGCPEETGGFQTTGIRNKKECTETIKVSGYWWYISGEVKWVGTVFAGMGGEFQKATREINITGQEYTCRGMDKVCWVCNCYYKSAAPSTEI